MVASLPSRRARRSPSRDALIEAHLDFARSVARRLAGRLPDCVDIEDLEADAYYGLPRAANSFDRDRGAAFRTYAARRIYGQMLDGLRERNQVRRGHPIPHLQSLDAYVGFENGRGVTLADQIAADQPPVGEMMEMRDEAELILRRLKPQSRQHLIDHYMHGKTQQEIADGAGVSPCAVSLRFRRIRKHIAQMGRGT